MMSGPAAKVEALERDWERILGSFKLGQSAEAAAIVFGIGGRDVGKRKLEEWVK